MEDVALYAMGLHPEIMKSADLVVGLPGKDPFDLLEAAAEKYLFGSCAYYLLAARATKPEDLTTESLDRMLAMADPKDDENCKSPLDALFEALDDNDDEEYDANGDLKPHHPALLLYWNFKHCLMSAAMEKAVVSALRKHLSACDEASEREEGPFVCTMTVKVSEKMKEEFESAAEEAGSSVPDALREAISSYLATHA